MPLFWMFSSAMLLIIGLVMIILYSFSYMSVSKKLGLGYSVLTLNLCW